MDVIHYATITRVRASDFEVVVDLHDRRRFKLANYYTEVRGPLPDVELKAGEYSAPMLRRRRIARFIELAVEEQRLTSQHPNLARVEQPHRG